MSDVWYPRPLGFWPLVLARWLFSFSFVLSKVLLFEKEKRIHIHWTPNPMWLCHLLQKWLIALIIQKNHATLSKCDNVIGNIQICMSR
jgi:hypothetical protein